MPESVALATSEGVAAATYLDAVNCGDKNVYFIDGKRLFGNKNRDACTVDGCHPNDFGFNRMADVIGDTLKELL